MTSVPHNFAEGQKVRYVRKVVESDGETVRLGQIGTVIEVRDNTEPDDVFGPATIVVAIDGDPAPGELRHEAVFRPEELERVRTDDTVPASEEDAVEYLTGVRPPERLDDRHGFSSEKPHTCKWADPHEGDHVCEVCGDTWSDESDDDQPIIDQGWSYVLAVDFMAAAGPDLPILSKLLNDPSRDPAEIAVALRAVADVLEGGVR